MILVEITLLWLTDLQIWNINKKYVQLTQEKSLEILDILCIYKDLAQYCYYYVFYEHVIANILCIKTIKYNDDNKALILYFW